MKFVHIGDCHLGGWRQPELKELNFRSFQKAIDACIKERADFLLVAGDLFDSAYPPIEVLKETFNEFRRLKEENIPVFIIAGSHDYSVSGKTFLDVLEKSGFCKNVESYTERKGDIILEPTIYKNVAIYGYPGRKSGLEVEDIKRIKLQDSPGMFKILMLHTTIKDAIKNLPIKAVDEKSLPNVNYLALGHLHINYNKEGRVYSGPTFPNTLSELDSLKYGSFYIFENGKITRQEIRLKEVVCIKMEISDALNATEKILSELEKIQVKDKIVILRLSGVIEKGKISDINFTKIERHLKGKEAYVFLKSISNLHFADSDIKIDFLDSSAIEGQIINKFQEANPSKFNNLIEPLIRALQIDKLEDERSAVFEERLVSESKKIFQI